MSKVFVIADLHLGHKSILTFSGEYRGGGKLQTIDEHDQWIVSQWNSVVTKRDLVWVLGDVCFEKTKLPLLKKMNGNKHLILGNHDEFSIQEYQKYFNKVHGFLKYKDVWLSHAPICSNSLRGKLNIHGHTHNRTTGNPAHICVSVEQLNGIPAEINRLLLNKKIDF